MLDEIVICKHCNKPEYWGEMRMVSGKYMCRDCYKADYESTRNAPYRWNDLDGHRPTLEEYEAQEANKLRG